MTATTAPPLDHNQGVFTGSNHGNAECGLTGGQNTGMGVKMGLGMRKSMPSGGCLASLGQEISLSFEEESSDVPSSGSESSDVPSSGSESSDAPSIRDDDATLMPYAFLGGGLSSLTSSAPPQTPTLGGVGMRKSVSMGSLSSMATGSSMGSLSNLNQMNLASLEEEETDDSFDMSPEPVHQHAHQMRALSSLDRQGEDVDVFDGSPEPLPPKDAVGKNVFDMSPEPLPSSGGQPPVPVHHMSLTSLSRDADTLEKAPTTRLSGSRRTTQEASKSKKKGLLKMIRKGSSGALSAMTGGTLGKSTSSPALSNLAAGSPRSSKSAKSVGKSSSGKMRRSRSKLSFGNGELVAISEATAPTVMVAKVVDSAADKDSTNWKGGLLGFNRSKTDNITNARSGSGIRKSSSTGCLAGLGEQHGACPKSCSVAPMPSCLKVRTQRDSLKVSYRGSKSSENIEESKEMDKVDQNNEARDDEDDMFCFYDVEDEEQEQKVAEPEAPVTLQRKVSFSKVQVHAHPIILGDNPAVTEGPPLSISWTAEFSDELDVDDYELDKPRPRRKEQLKIPKYVREEWLKEEGFTRRQFNRVDRDVQWIKKCRDFEKSKGRKVKRSSSSS